MWDLYYLYPYFDLILHYSKKIRDTKGIFHAKMGSVKDRNGMDLKEADILRRGGKHRRTIQKRSSWPS